VFGHVKGSFTGAYRDKPGKLEMARHGTIFLDEIGEMTLRMQGLLLRFLETGEIQKVGAERWRGRERAGHRGNQPQPPRSDHQGLFREDLFLPPQRHSHRGAAAARTREDIPLLVEHFLRNFTDAVVASDSRQVLGPVVSAIGPEAMRRSSRPLGLAMSATRERRRTLDRHRAARAD
jgi:two-component system NtrC family response regulator